MYCLIILRLASLAKRKNGSGCGGLKWAYSNLTPYIISNYRPVKRAGGRTN